MPEGLDTGLAETCVTCAGKSIPAVAVRVPLDPDRLLVVVKEDGYLRAAGRLSKHDTRPVATAYLDDTAAPVVGRVSMDMVTVDVSAAPAKAAQPGGYIELIGDRFTADDLADVAGTIGYEVLTRLGQRHHRIYRGGVTA